MTRTGLFHGLIVLVVCAACGASVEMSDARSDPDAGPLPDAGDRPRIPDAAVGECSDGIDNDGDGLVDWQYDLGCFDATDATEAAGPREAEGGWTTYDPSPETRIVYVSSSTGDDTTGTPDDRTKSGSTEGA